MTSDKLQSHFRHHLPVAIEALEGALDRYAGSPGEAEESLRRIAHQLRGSGGSYGYPEITEAAQRLEEADLGSLATEARSLLDLLQRLAAEPVSSAISILLIEDEPTTAQLIRTLLEIELDARVYVAGTAEAGLALYHEHDPALVLLDLILPDRDGRSMLIDLKKDPGARDLPVLVLSAHSASAVRSECLLLGALDFIEKPIQPETFVPKVRDVLNLSHAREKEQLPTIPLKTVEEAVSCLHNKAAEGAVVGVIDVDHFRRVFDEQGKRIADEVIAQVAQRILAGLREQDNLCGAERDDFFVLLPDTSLDDAVERLSRLKDAVAEKPFVTRDGTSYDLTFSAGLARVEADSMPDIVLTDARRALAQAKRAGRNTIHTATNADRSPRVLIAEDDPMIVRLVQHRLSRAGLDVTVVDNGRDALEKANGEAYDLILLDVKMPIFDGFEVTRRLRQQEAFKTVPIVLFTSMGSERDVVRGFDLGVDDYITKPFSPTELLARLLHLLRKRV